MAPKRDEPGNQEQPTDKGPPAERVPVSLGEIGASMSRPTDAQPERQLLTREERIKRRNDRLAALRERSGLSMDDLAKEMGFKGQSSIQRYLSPTYDKGFRPELVSRFKASFLGRGDPPIKLSDMEFLDNWAETPAGETVDIMGLFNSHLEANGTSAGFEEQLAALGLARDRTSVASILSRMRRIKALEIDENVERVAGLPLAEGDVILKIPRQLSSESAETLRNWLEHMIGLATARK